MLTTIATLKGATKCGFSQHITLAMEDEIPEMLLDESDGDESHNQSAQYCIVRIPSLTAQGEGEEEYDYLFVNLRGFNVSPKGVYKKNKVPLQVLRGPLWGIWSVDDPYYSANSLNHFEFDEVKCNFEKVAMKYFDEKERGEILEILKEIYGLGRLDGDAIGGAIHEYFEFVRGKLSHTYHSKGTMGIHVFCYDCSKDAAENKKLYNELVKLVKHLVSLGRKLSKCISSKFEKEANEIKENEIKERYVYLRCIPFEKRDGGGLVYRDEEKNYLLAMYDIYSAMAYVKWWALYYVSLLAYFERMHGCGNFSFCCQECNQDAEYEFYDQKLGCRSEDFCKNIDIEGNTCIRIKPRGKCKDPFNEFFINQLKAKASDIVLVDAIKHIEKLKAEYLVSKKLEFLKNKNELINYKGELIRQLKREIIIECNLGGFTLKDLKDIGVKSIVDLEKKLYDIIKEARSEKILDQIVEDAINEAKENSEIKKLAGDIGNIIRDGVDKIVKNLKREGEERELKERKLTEEDIAKILNIVRAPIRYYCDGWSCQPNEDYAGVAELIMKLEYGINKLIHDKYPGINRKKMRKVYEALFPYIPLKKDLRLVDLSLAIAVKLEELLGRENSVFRIRAEEDK